MTTFTLSDKVRRQLGEVLLEDEDLLASLRRLRPEEHPERPGMLHCRCTVAVRRPLDPETSELRELDVLLRPTAEGMEAVELTGLEGVAAQFD